MVETHRKVAHRNLPALIIRCFAAIVTAVTIGEILAEFTAINGPSRIVLVAIAVSAIFLLAPWLWHRLRQ
jgi:hypothetical protein